MPSGPRRHLAPLFLVLPTLVAMGAPPSLPGLASPLAGQQAPANLIVTTEWLAANTAGMNLVLLHVGREEEYALEHIPGARLVHTGELAVPHEEGALNLELPDPGVLARTLDSLGIGDDSRVVVYYGNDWVSPATRILFTLDWIGLGDRAFFLEGGLPKWKAEGRPITAETPPAPAPATLTPRPQPEKVVQAEWVRDHLHTEGYAVIDARGPEAYSGARATHFNGEPVRSGHIPGAANIYAADLMDEETGLKSREEIARIFAAAGIEEGDTVVAYCHLGQYATVVAFGARLLGYPVVLYDGSFQEWGRLEGYPVENPAGGRM